MTDEEMANALMEKGPRGVQLVRRFRKARQYLRGVLGDEWSSPTAISDAQAELARCRELAERALK